MRGSFASHPGWPTNSAANVAGRPGVSWYLDETYVKVAGRWGYLYRAIDGDGELLDSMLSEHRYASRRTITPPTAKRSAGSWGDGCSTGVANI